MHASCAVQAACTRRTPCMHDSLQLLLQAAGKPALAAAHLPLQLSLGALQILEQQVLARQLVVVWEVVDALPV